MSEQTQHAPARPYADTARDYWRAGWANPIPVRGKWPPPTGYTGYDGRPVSYRDLQAWIDGDEAGFNIALRLPGDVVGIDVDAYDDKSGAESISQAEAELGPLPPTSKSTSRAPLGKSSIRFYRVPANVDLRGAEKRFRARFGDHVDIIRRDHRYAVTWPSVHPVTGDTYGWYDADGAPCEVPSPTLLPELPPTWVEFLTQSPDNQQKQPESHAEPSSSTSGSSPWDLPRQFTREQAVKFIRPHFDALRAAPTGTINNLLNDASMVLSHFVPAFWSQDEATRFLLDALVDTAYDGRTWRAESTIHSGLGAAGWKAELIDARPADHEADSWQPLSLGPYLRGEIARPEPTVGVARQDRLRFIYPGKEHSVIGEMESGKSWFASASVADELTKGKTVVYIHFEEADPSDTVERLQALGVANQAIEQRFRFVAPNRPVSTDRMARLLDPVPSLAILDGVNEGMAMHGQAVREEDGVAAFRRTLIRPFIQVGTAVLGCDHVVKDKESRGRYALGSIHKGNALSGALILLENADPFGRNARGRSHVYVTKDRPGHLRRHGRPTKTPGKTFMGEMVVDDTRTFVNYLDLAIVPPSADTSVAADAGGGVADDELVMAIVVELTAAGQEANLRAMRARTGISKDRTDNALTRLVIAGLLVETPGPNRARLFSVAQDPLDGAVP